MLRTLTLAAVAAAFAAPAFAGSGCNYGHSSAQASVVPEASYAPVAASAVTVEDSVLQSTPIDDSALVYETDAVIDTVETVVIPEG